MDFVAFVPAEQTWRACDVFHIDTGSDEQVRLASSDGPQRRQSPLSSRQRRVGPAAGRRRRECGFSTIDDHDLSGVKGA